MRRQPARRPSRRSCLDEHEVFGRIEIHGERPVELHEVGARRGCRRPVRLATPDAERHVDDGGRPQAEHVRATAVPVRDDEDRRTCACDQGVDTPRQRRGDERQVERDDDDRGRATGDASSRPSLTPSLSPGPLPHRPGAGLRCGRETSRSGLTTSTSAMAAAPR